MWTKREGLVGHTGQDTACSHYSSKRRVPSGGCPSACADVAYQATCCAQSFKKLLYDFMEARAAPRWSLLQFPCHRIKLWHRLPTIVFPKFVSGNQRNEWFWGFVLSVSAGPAFRVCLLFACLASLSAGQRGGGLPSPSMHVCVCVCSVVRAVQQRWPQQNSAKFPTC